MTEKKKEKLIIKLRDLYDSGHGEDVKLAICIAESQGIKAADSELFEDWIDRTITFDNNDDIDRLKNTDITTEDKKGVM